MERRRIMSEASEILLKEGTVKIGGHRREPIFALVGTEVWPYFSPIAVKRKDGYQLLGSVGLYVKDFETWWSEIFRQKITRKDVRDDALFALYITNLAEFRDPPMIERDSDMHKLEKWIMRIVNGMCTLPKSMREINEKVGEEVIRSFPLDAMVGHPVKAYAFNKWCRQTGRQLNESVKSDDQIRRLDPYEEIFSCIAGGQNS